jgi:two-component system chemotaxis sensor kinase CheA
MDDDFFNKLFETFKVEAQDHVKSISSGLFELEARPNPQEAEDILEIVYRQAHSLKGAARAVGFTEVENTCQAMESVFASIRDKGLRPDPAAFDLLHESIDTVERLIFSSSEEDATALQQKLIALASGQGQEREPSSESEQAAQPGPELPATDIFEPQKEDMPEQASEPQHGRQEEDPSPKDTAREKFDTIMANTQVGAETVRISVDKLEELLVKAEEMLSIKLGAAQRALELSDIMGSLDEWRHRWKEVSPFVNGASDESAIDVERIKEFLVWNQELFLLLNERVKALADSAASDSASFGEMVNDLLEDMKIALMVPSSSLLDIFPRVVRDLSKELGKEVDLQLHGGALEIDRRILEEMKDPLIHLVRNAIDHGLEDPRARESIGKPRQGKLKVTFSGIGGGKAEILVSDDGGGIDPVKVKQAAQKIRAKAGPQERDTPGDDRLDLIFRSGVSTSPIVSHISGRGLGLAIVREKVDKLGGRVSLETTLGRGTTFRIALPMSLATFRGILVECSDNIFVAPTSTVVKALRFDTSLIRTEEGRDTIEFEGLAIPLARLSKVLELPGSEGGSKDPAGLIQAIVLRSEDTYCAFTVDSIIGEREVLVKSLGKQLVKVRNIGGATILGDGGLAPILNARDLVKSVSSSTTAQWRFPGPGDEAAPPKEILVAEDSITSRMLIKNILESAGYNVTTAVDGAQAWSMLKSGAFDLLVSDVEMPNMNGFELTSKIRARPELSNLPVALVTGLGSKEHMERGIDAGANAYIPKSGFEQGELIDLVKRLI